ncbi:MAG TPA: LysE family transporter [Streptosporangiaceae bacterium]|nr:LysE family transporter [Streptosporangiaceae bacterium]
MAASSVIAFWVVAFLLIVVPGPDWAFAISASLRGGSVIAAVAGLAVGYATLTAVVAAGVGALVARTPGILTALTVAGGLYLMWHGARTFARPAPPAAAAGRPATAASRRATTSRALLVRGIGVSGLNPKGLLVFLAVLPQFATPRGSWPLAAQLGLLGLVFTLTCAAFYLGLGSSARKILRTRPGAAAAVTRFSGAAMTVIGAVLLAERLLA